MGPFVRDEMVKIQPLGVTFLPLCWGIKPLSIPDFTSHFIKFDQKHVLCDQDFPLRLVAVHVGFSPAFVRNGIVRDLLRSAVCSQAADSQVQEARIRR